MTYRFECRCGKKLAAQDKDLGEEIRCPQCGTRVLLPLASEEKHRYLEREPLAQIAFILSLLPLALIAYTVIETALSGGRQWLGILYNILGTALWLGQVATVVLAAVSLSRIKRAQNQLTSLYGEHKATFALLLGVTWLTLLVLSVFFSLMWR